MARRRKAWLWGGDGIRVARGKRLPGYYVRWSDYAGQRRINRTACFVSSKTAREFVRRHNARVDLRLVGDVVPIALREAVPEYIRSLGAHTQRTLSQIGITLGLFSRDRADDDVCELTPRDIDTWLTDRLRTCTSTTVAGDRTCLHAFFHWCVDAGYSAANPVDQTHVRPPRMPRRRPSVTEEQLATLINALDTEDRRIAALLAMTSGLDRGVIRGLTAADIDWTDGVVHLATRPKTRRSGKPLVVALHPDLLPHLSQRRVQRPPPQPLLLGLSREHRDRDWWHKAAVAAGVPTLLFRDLRALAATRLQRLGGATLSDAQVLLGHASIATTGRHYYAPHPATRQALARVPLPASPDGPGSTPATPAAAAAPASE